MLSNLAQSVSFLKIRGITCLQQKSTIVAGQALPGLMVPEDVVSAYLFLASDLAANITGQALNVDRGEVMQ